MSMIIHHSNISFYLSGRHREIKCVSVKFTMIENCIWLRHTLTTQPWSTTLSCPVLSCPVLPLSILFCRFIQHDMTLNFLRLSSTGDKQGTSLVWKSTHLVDCIKMFVQFFMTRKRGHSRMILLQHRFFSLNFSKFSIKRLLRMMIRSWHNVSQLVQ